jgi:hypothetical protein
MEKGTKTMTDEQLMQTRFEDIETNGTAEDYLAYFHLYRKHARICMPGHPMHGQLAFQSLPQQLEECVFREHQGHKVLG